VNKGHFMVIGARARAREN